MGGPSTHTTCQNSAVPRACKAEPKASAVGAGKAKPRTLRGRLANRQKTVCQEQLISWGCSVEHLSKRHDSTTRRLNGGRTHDANVVSSRDRPTATRTKMPGHHLWPAISIRSISRSSRRPVAAARTRRQSPASVEDFPRTPLTMRDPGPCWLGQTLRPERSWSVFFTRRPEQRYPV